MACNFDNEESGRSGPNYSKVARLLGLSEIDTIVPPEEPIKVDGPEKED
jgi:hypothetical protein